MIPPILRFKPIYKDKIWGGRKLETILSRTIPQGGIGETWEISDYGEDLSIIQNGPWKGKSFRSLYKKYPQKVLGEGFENTDFPLLIKIIDAKEKLSIQVHPNDEYSKTKDPENPGKMEAWIVLQADPGSELGIGFNQTMTKEEYKELVLSNQAETVLKKIPVQPGDAFLLEPGTIHAIGGGVLLLEIQQSSDSTYRVYDYGRPRELHLEKALDVLNFQESKGKEKLSYKKVNFSGAGNLYCLTENPKFRIFILELNSETPNDPNDYYLPRIGKRSCFHIYTILEGSLSFPSGETFTRGDSFLVTAEGMKENLLYQKTSTSLKIVVSTVGTEWDTKQ